MRVAALEGPVTVPLWGWAIVAFLAVRLLGGPTSVRGWPYHDDLMGVVWGEGATAPAGWNPEDNGIYIDPQCRYVLEGRGFLPDGGITGEIMFNTLLDNLAEGNSAWAFVWRMDQIGRTPDAIANEIFRQVSPLCFDAGPDGWSPAVTRWYQTLATRIRAGVGGG